MKKWTEKVHELWNKFCGFKRLFAGFGAGIILTVITTAAIPLYVVAIALLEWRAYIIFPLISGAAAFVMIYFFAKSQRSLEEVIEEKVKQGKKKKLFLVLFNASKFLAFLFSAVVLGPYLTPLVIRAAEKDVWRAYLYSAFLNALATAIWIRAYLGGISLFKYIWDTIKLSIGA